MWVSASSAHGPDAEREAPRPALTWGVGLIDKLLKETKVTQVDEVAVLELGGLGPLDALVAEGAPAPALAADEMRRPPTSRSPRNNLEQLALAFHIHHDGFKTLPAATVCDKDGKPCAEPWRGHSAADRSGRARQAVPPRRAVGQRTQQGPDSANAGGVQVAWASSAAGGQDPLPVADRSRDAFRRGQETHSRRREGRLRRT